MDLGKLLAERLCHLYFGGGGLTGISSMNMDSWSKLSLRFISFIQSIYYKELNISAPHHLFSGYFLIPEVITQLGFTEVSQSLGMSSSLQYC